MAARFAALCPSSSCVILARLSSYEVMPRGGQEVSGQAEQRTRRSAVLSSPAAAESTAASSAPSASPLLLLLIRLLRLQIWLLRLLRLLPGRARHVGGMAGRTQEWASGGPLSCNQKTHQVLFQAPYLGRHQVLVSLSRWSACSVANKTVLVTRLRLYPLPSAIRLDDVRFERRSELVGRAVQRLRTRARVYA